MFYYSDVIIVNVCVNVLALSQGGIQLAGCTRPGGSADGGRDHDPGLVSGLLPGKTHAARPYGQQT